MAYKRPDPKKLEKEHPLEKEFGIYGFINTNNDPSWISPYVQELMDDSRFALHQLRAAIDSAKKLEMNDYKPEVAAQKRAEMILKAKRAVMSFLKKHRQKYEDEVAAVENTILRVTEPAQPSEAMKLMLQEMRFREIRDNLRNIEPKKRRDAVAGNLERMQAIIGNPDKSDTIISADALTELRMDYAYKQDPTLVEQLKDQREIYRAVRARAGEVSATSAKMLIDAKLDDPLPPQEFFDAFPPQTEYESALAIKRIQQWEKIQNEVEKKKAFNENRAGLNFEAGERADRTSMGVQHQ